MTNESLESKLVEDPETLYDVRAVATMTGLAAAKLRVWEKRHAIVDPVRSETGRRLYRQADIDKLKLLKRLIDQGHSIGSLASLSTLELESLAGATIQSPTLADASDQCRIVLVGDALQDLFELPEMQIDGAIVSAKFESLVKAEEATEPTSGDLLLLDVPAIFPETIARIEQLNDTFGTLRATLFYSFAPGTVLDGIPTHRISLVRMPRKVEEVRAQCEREVSLATARHLATTAAKKKHSTRGIPARRFTDRELTFISRISPVIECECPNHLAELLTSLIGFEQYSAECQNRNRADERMHAYLHQRTAKARSIIEEALQQLMEFEGISLSTEETDSSGVS